MGAAGKLAVWLDRRFGWHRLPVPLGMIVLAEMREPPARAEPLRHRPADRPLRPSDRRRSRGGALPHGALAVPEKTADGEGPTALHHLADDRRDLQRPRAPADGQHGHAFRAQLPARAHVPGAGAQLLTPNPRRSAPSCTRASVRPRDHAQHPRRGLAPVRGARLVQPRPERRRRAVAGVDRGRRRVARAADEDPAHAADATRRPDGAPDLGHRRYPLVGRLADLRPRQGLHRQDARAERAASCASTRTGCCRRARRGSRLRRRARHPLDRPRPSCTRCSRSSTTRSATASRPSIRPGRTTGSTTARG